MTFRNVTSAVGWAKAQRSYDSGMCLKFVRNCYKVPPKYASAAIAWNKTKYRPTSTPPKGVPVWWTGGSRGFGHVAISDGGGYVVSTDTGGKGRVGRTSIKHITRSWRQTYRGWTEDINGVRVYVQSDSKPATPVLDASAVARMFRTRTKSNAVLIIQKALAVEVGLDFSSGPGIPGPRTRKAYAAWQRRLGFRGDDANGIPGYTSLLRLGTKRGFGVVR